MPRPLPILLLLATLATLFLLATNSRDHLAKEDTTPSSWTKHTIVAPQTNHINSVVAADWNNDGRLDIITSYQGKVVLHTAPDWAPHLLFEFKEGLARNKPRSTCIHSCLLDVDGDGDQDFIGSNNTVFWLECPNEQPLLGPWTYRVVDDEILGTHCLITGDVDRDGTLDLIANSGRTEGATTVPDSVAWLTIPEDPHTAEKWTRHVFADRDAPNNSHYMGLGDVNGDGRPDISCAAKGHPETPNSAWFAWWEQPEDPTQMWKKHLLSEENFGASNILPADLNGDGHPDYFATRGHSQGIFWFEGPDFTQQHSIDPDLVFPHSLALADLDEDGDIDAVTCGKEADGQAVWYENDGKANFTKHILTTDQGSYDTRLVDMDDDGDLDVLLAGHASKNVVWLENPRK